jgi:hypothetical protein
MNMELDQVKSELKQILEYLKGAEKRATQSGDELEDQDPESSRYAAEAGSLLATCDMAVKELEGVLHRLGDRA